MVPALESLALAVSFSSFCSACRDWGKRKELREDEAEREEDDDNEEEVVVVVEEEDDNARGNIIDFSS